LVKYKSKDVGRSERVKNTKSAGNRVCDCHDMLLACLAMTGEGYKGWLKGSHREKPGSL